MNNIHLIIIDKREQKNHISKPKIKNSDKANQRPTDKPKKKQHEKNKTRT